MSLRVLINALRAHPGGVMVYRAELVKGLSARPDVEVIVVSSPSFARSLSFPGVEVLIRDIGNPPFNRIRERRIIASICDQINPDVVHLPVPLVSGWLRCSSVVTVHDLGHEFLPIGRVQRAYRQMALASAVRRSGAIIAISEHTCERLVEHFPAARQKTRVIPHGCRRPESLPPLEATPSSASGKPYLFAFGHWAHKGAAAAVRVLAELRASLPDLELRILGSNPVALSAAMQTARELGVIDQIRPLGFVPEDELWNLYRGATALVFLSAYEGFGLPVIEAMLMGCPVVASDRGALPEIMGVHGHVVPIDAWEEAAAFIRRHLEDPEWSIACRREAREFAKTCTWDKAVELTLDTYRLAAKKRQLRQRPVSWVDPAWGWPDEVIQLLEQISGACGGPGFRSALLMGSTSRGELSMGTTGGELMLRSDVEFYVLSDHPRQTRREMEPLLREIEQAWAQRWPGFHVDASYLTVEASRRLKPQIRHFELKRNAKVLAGEDTRNLLPEVNIRDLDWRELNEIALWRLLSLVLPLDRGVITNRRPLNFEERHALARNLLDVTTWAWPGSGRLLPNFRARVDEWLDKGPPEATVELELPTGNLLLSCLNCRRNDSLLPEGDTLFVAVTTAWEEVWGAITGSCTTQHRGAGKGVRRLDLLRRIRAAWRVRGFGGEVLRCTLRDGPLYTAGSLAAGLSKVAQSMRSGIPMKKELEDLGRGFGLEVTGESIDLWCRLRKQLAFYVSAVLAQPSWETQVPSDEYRK